MAEGFYLVVFGVGLGLLLVTFLLGELFEFGGEIAHDIGGLFDHDVGAVGAHGLDLGGTAEPRATPFTSRMLFVFAAAFGGAGFIGAASGLPVLLSAALGLVVGFGVAAAGFFLIIRPLAGQQGTSQDKPAEFVGLRATVTSGIPAGGWGQISFTAAWSGTRRVEAARSVDGRPVLAGTAVRIVRPAGPGVTVEPIEKEL